MRRACMFLFWYFRLYLSVFLFLFFCLRFSFLHFALSLFQQGRGVVLPFRLKCTYQWFVLGLGVGAGGGSTQGELTERTSTWEEILTFTQCFWVANLTRPQSWKIGWNWKLGSSAILEVTWRNLFVEICIQCLWSPDVEVRHILDTQGRKNWLWKPENIKFP